MLQTLSYRSPQNRNGYDFITLSAWDNGNSGIGFCNETITFVLQVNIVPQNDPPVISINGTDLGLFYDDARNVALKLGATLTLSQQICKERYGRANKCLGSVSFMQGAAVLSCLCEVTWVRFPLLSSRWDGLCYCRGAVPVRHEPGYSGRSRDAGRSRAA
jgi:hypothetical protein